MSTMHPTSAAPWLILAAARVEAEPFVESGLRGVNASDDRAESGQEAGPLALACPGVGRAGDGAVAEALRRLRPAAAINVGFAGALADDLAPGDVVVVSAWADPGAAPGEGTSAIHLAKSDETLCASLAGTLRAAGVSARTCVGVTVDEPLHGSSAREALHARTGASVVEMEGAAWARIAITAEVLFAGVRVISDNADLRLPRPRHHLMSSSGRVRWARWAGALLTTGRWTAPVREVAKLRKARRDWLAAMASLRGTARALARLAVRRSAVRRSAEP